MNILEYIYLQSLLYEVDGEYVILDDDLSRLYKCDIKEMRKIFKKNKFSREFYF